jgi:hypothetical protein
MIVSLSKRVKAARSCQAADGGLPFTPNHRSPFDKIFLPKQNPATAGATSTTAAAISKFHGAVKLPRD